MVDEKTKKFEQTVRDLLQEQFSNENEFEFDPIVVVPRFDDDGQEYLHSYIVFQGDQKKLDPRRTLRLSSLLWSRAEELGYPGVPIQLFVKKSEWPALKKSLV